ncbi:hypothetical protein VitviT2T_006954 [Vitis vinifera]|uniref:Uncharacterized protein n=1 Tax=Vitis vinifera TaxID=29760 RepID=A0ABY9BYA0_VITVI|nr:hypothetical protein VitviT2T_006954 [Vitis vinifera]
MCQEGFDKWYNRQAPNPNALEGAIVSGPDQGNDYGGSSLYFCHELCAHVCILEEGAGLLCDPLCLKASKAVLERRNASAITGILRNLLLKTNWRSH